jgi:hypothetical protein
MALAATIAMLLLPTGAKGQGGPTLSALATGDTLRVWAVTPRLNGTMGILDRFGRDTLTLLGMEPVAEQRPLVAQVPLMGLRRVDVRRGLHRSGSRIALSALVGAAAGALVGAVLGPVVECSGSCNDDPDLAGVAGFIVGTGGGILVGGLAGGTIGFFHKSPNWVAVRLVR